MTWAASPHAPAAATNTSCWPTTVTAMPYLLSPSNLAMTAITLPLIASGAVGVISVVNNAFPELFNQMVHEALEGNYAAARKKHLDLLPVTKMLFEEGNPGGVKVALETRGILSGYLRLPLVPVSDSLKQRIVTETNRLVHV